MPRQYAQLPTDDNADVSLGAQTKYLSNGGTLVIESTRRYTYAYGPPGLKGLLQNSFAFRCSLFASLGGLTFGYDQGVIANVLVMKDFVSRWPIGPWEKGLMSVYCHSLSLLTRNSPASLLSLPVSYLIPSHNCLVSQRLFWNLEH